MSSQKNTVIVAGLGLIVLGMAIFFLRNANIGLGRGYITIFLGGLLLIGYLWKKHSAFLVPGCLLLALGLGSIGRRSFLDWDRGDFVPLGLGFLAIFVIKFLYEKKTLWWPLIPGLVFLFAGFTYLEHWFRKAAENWPLIVVVIGLLIVLSAMFSKGRKDDPEVP